MKMELMSSLLLFALTLVPQALGKTRTFPYGSGLNDSVGIAEKFLTDKDILTTKVSDLQSVFTDLSCINCSSCMEQAIVAHSNYMNKINIENFHGLENQEINIRDKRASADKLHPKIDKKTKRPKNKKNKSTSITKLNDKEKIYGLKITETNVLSDSNSSRTITSCQVYSVKKSFPCESPEANIFLKESKRKINKKSKKEKSKKEKIPSDKTTMIAPVFRKRQIDDSQVPEQIMPSIEEMY